MAKHVPLNEELDVDGVKSMRNFPAVKKRIGVEDDNAVASAIVNYAKQQRIDVRVLDGMLAMLSPEKLQQIRQIILTQPSKQSPQDWLQQMRQATGLTKLDTPPVQYVAQPDLAQPQTGGSLPPGGFLDEKQALAAGLTVQSPMMYVTDSRAGVNLDQLRKAGYKYVLNRGTNPSVKNYLRKFGGTIMVL